MPDDAIKEIGERVQAIYNDIRNAALEEAAKVIEAKHTNNVGMVHPMAQGDAARIRTLKAPT